MPPTTIALDVRGSMSAGDPVFVTESGLVATTIGDLGSITLLPAAFIPTGQEYYWTRAWQEGEIETLASLAMGDGRRFDTADDLVAWLRSDDED